MTRILQAMAGAERGGAEAFFERFVIAMHRAGIQQHVLIRSNPERARKLSAAGLAPIELSFGGPLDMTTRWTFKREIQRFQPQIVMTWMNRASRFCPDGPFVRVGRLGGYYDLKYYQGCDHLIGNTQDIVNYLIRKGWPEDRAHYLPNFAHVDDAPALDRKTLFTPRDAPLLLAMGRFHENKGFDVLIKALARLPGVYLWLAGDGPLRPELDDLAQTLGVKPRVRFLGWREDIGPLYRAADIFVCSSRHEPLGNVVLEAWGHGTAVVAADAVGPGVLIDHGETGLLASVDDPQSLADAIEMMIEDPDHRASMAAAGKAKYEAEFSESVVIDTYRAFFDRIAASVVMTA